MDDIKNEELKLEKIPKSIEEEVKHFAYSFNGYNFAGSLQECGYISRKVKISIEENKIEELSLSELRTCLFFHYRAIRHRGDQANKEHVNKLLELIRDRVSENKVE